MLPSLVTTGEGLGLGVSTHLNIKQSLWQRPALNGIGSPPPLLPQNCTRESEEIAASSESSALRSLKSAVKASVANAVFAVFANHPNHATAGTGSARRTKRSLDVRPSAA